VCQQCHVYTSTNIYASWASSAHGYGAIDPVFNAALFNAKQQVKDVERWSRSVISLRTGCKDIRWMSGIVQDYVFRVIAPLHRTAPIRSIKQRWIARSAWISSRRAGASWAAAVH
jgi:hypothetical protein